MFWSLVRVLLLCVIEIVSVAADAQVGSTGRASSAEQNGSGASMTLIAEADIPFDFWIGPERMPAGRYELDIIAPSVTLIRNINGKNEHQVYTLAIGPPVSQSDSKLVFVTRNGKSMLAELWCTEGTRGLTASATRQPGEPVNSISLSYH